MKIAIIGTGISGMLAAYLLEPDHDVEVFEANDYIGGHTNTISVERGGRSIAVDTGFIVYNKSNYPNFVTLLNRLGVATQPSDMSFSVSCERTGLEYNPNSLNTLFGQRRNLLRPAFYGMIRDILKFHRDAPDVLNNGHRTETLGEFLDSRGYGRAFVDHHIVPLGAAIWSADPARFLEMPALFFVRFFANHGMLSVNKHPQWRVIRGGSRQYVGPLTDSYRGRVRLHCPVEAVTRSADHVEVKAAGSATERFDQVVIATHSDQALKMLTDASADENRILGAIPYQSNDTVLHTDASVLPRRRRVWASWNYHLPKEPMDRATMTYHMNRLQSLEATDQFCVSLNVDTRVNPKAVLRRMTYRHPVFTRRGVEAQQYLDRISGVNRTYYCGAYWGNGFHEDGVNGALAVCMHFGKTL